MSKPLRYTFTLIGVMVATYLVFQLTMGDASRRMVWSKLEPVFQQQWVWNTQNNGKVMGDLIDSQFQNAREVSN